MPALSGLRFRPRGASATSWRTSAPAAMLHAGGDERLRFDPRTGRNSYGVAARPPVGEVHFGSCTASPLSPRGREAADGAWRRLLASREPLADWFDTLRARILAFCGDPDADCVLTASGTDAELVALAIASATWGRPITNILVAPEETGSGAPLAARGAHFLASSPHAAGIRKGAPLAGWQSHDISVEAVEIRRADGSLRDAGEVDQEVEELACVALAQGRGALIHLLDVSKTGASGLGVAAARRIVDRAPDRTLTLADCCQLRSSPARLNVLARQGFMVALTGSKFAGGPPFSGALITPRGLLAGLDPAALPRGLGAHCARLDWPAEIADRIAAVATTYANPGLGLRWTAALSEMEPFKSHSDGLLAEIHLRFARAVEAGVVALEGASLPPPTLGGARAGLFPVLLSHPDGTGFSRDEASAVQSALREGRAFHVGQPVRIGGAHALRVCLSAPLINDIAERVQAGAPIARAFAPLAADLGELFEKWRHVQNTGSCKR